MVFLRLALFCFCAALAGCGLLDRPLPSIRLVADPTGEGLAFFEFAVDRSPGPPPPRGPPPPAAGPEAVSVVRVVLDDADADLALPPLAGQWSRDGDVVRFRPRFPLEPGLRYRAELHPGDGPPIVREFVWRAAAAAVEAPRVTAVFPSGERVPANLLKLYVHFSRPMATGEVYRRIRLLDAGGDEVAHPFLELDEELWNRGGTRVTVFFDPGRVKRELRPNAEVGPALVAGETYTIDIDAAWPSADGVPLAGVHRRTLRVEDPDRTSPDPAAWSLTPPLAGTRDPLVLAFPEPLDHALLERLLWIRGPDNVEVDGEVRVGDRERVWSFRPVGSWAAGVHQLVVGSALEDLAGNSVDRLFEVEVFREIRVPVVSTDVSLEFRVEPPDSSRREP